MQGMVLQFRINRVQAFRIARADVSRASGASGLSLVWRIPLHHQGQDAGRGIAEQFSGLAAEIAWSWRAASPLSRLERFVLWASRNMQGIFNVGLQRNGSTVQ